MHVKLRLQCREDEGTALPWDRSPCPPSYVAHLVLGKEQSREGWREGGRERQEEREESGGRDKRARVVPNSEKWAALFVSGMRYSPSGH
jgi:hypothetical protein